MSVSTNINNDSRLPYPSDEKNRSVIIFIIGPWARKWFPCPQYGVEQAENEKIRWILAPDAEDLHKQLQRLRLPSPNIITMAFFPFLPDGQESNQLTLTEIANWQSAFCARPLSEPLRCIFGLYARLSHERSIEDPDRAIWLGGIDVTSSKEISLNHELAALHTILKQQSLQCRYHTLQRFAMADVLQLWMYDTGVMKSLQTLFSQTSLKLTGVLLSDYSEGFVRHGAWANWIASRFKIYPGLAATMSLPQLPDVLYNPEIETAIAITKNPQRKAGWWYITTIALLLAFLLAGTTWLEGEHLIVVKKHLEAFNQIDDSYIKDKREAFNQLMKYRNDLSDCSDRKIMQFLRLSGCRKVLANIEKYVEIYKSSPFFYAAESVELFSSGSSALEEGSEEILASLLPVINSNPETTFMIVGHSDNSGSHKINMSLSEKRAAVVRDWLINKTDISFTRLLVKGVGDTAPIASNDTEEGRKKNRRVDIIPIQVNQHTNNE